MQGLSFKVEWVDAEGIRGPELAATCAELEIRVDDAIVTRVRDAETQAVSDTVVVSVYPLAEWMATNWWFLTHETSNPAKEGDPDFRNRHTLAAAREGYAYPDLQMVPQGSRTHLAWSPDTPAWTSIEFVERGEAWIDSAEFRAACADFIARVIRRLAFRGVEGTLLQEEWSAIQGADPEEIKFCTAAARRGWDPYSMNGDQRAFVLARASAAGQANQA